MISTLNSRALQRRHRDRCEEWPSRKRKRFRPAAFSRVCGSKTLVSHLNMIPLFVHPLSEYENLLRTVSVSSSRKLVSSVHAYVILLTFSLYQPATIFFALKTVDGLIELPSAPIVTRAVIVCLLERPCLCWR